MSVLPVKRADENRREYKNVLYYMKLQTQDQLQQLNLLLSKLDVGK